MLESLLLLGVLQGAPAMASCTRLEACLQTLRADASHADEETYPEPCDALRARLLASGDLAKEHLLDLARSADPRLRNMAGCVLGGWPTWKAADLPALEQAIAMESDGGWIVRAMVHFPPRIAVPVLGGILAKDGASNQAGYALAQLMPQGLDAFLHFASNRSPSTRGSLAWNWNSLVLGTDGPTRIQAVFRELAKAANETDRPAAERVVALDMLADVRLHARAVGPALRGLLASSDLSIRHAARMALLAMRDPSMLDEVLASCPTVDGRDPRSDLLGHSPPPLIDVDVPDDDEAPQCLDFLSGMEGGAARAAPMLLPYLHSSRWRWRTQAALTLGKLDNRSVASQLRPLLEDKDWQVVAAAILAEAQLHDQGALPAIEKLSRRHWMYSVRQAAAEAASALRSGDVTGLEQLYAPRRSSFGLLLGNPLPAPAHPCPLDAGLALPMQLTLAGGALRGIDHGEFGGGLVWQGAGKAPKTLLTSNISGLFGLSPRSAWVVAGPAPMGFDTALLYRAHIDADGQPRISLVITLPGYASQRTAARGELQLGGRDGSYALKPGDPEGRSATIRELDCAHR